MRALRGVLVTAGMAAVLPAHAVLGGDLASVQADTLALQGQRRASTALDHSVHEIVMPDGARQRQYVNARGRVFRVDWVQQGKPRLDGLLGAYAADYRAALQRQAAMPVMRRQLTVEAGDLVVQSGSYLNRHTGSAWLRSELPAAAGLPR